MKTICFLGDSITHHGGWVAEVFENIKDEYIVYNCGIGGDKAVKALYRLHTNCLSHNPDKVVIMFGMNDIERDLYSEFCQDENIDEKKQSALDIYKASMTELVETITSYGMEVILCTPTPLDDIHYPEQEKNYCNIALAKCGETVKELAKKYGCECVDFFDIIYKYIQNGKVKCPDTVHPDPESEHVMAQVFMKELGITDSIDIETPFVMSDINRQRFTAEQELKRLEMVEWVFLNPFKAEKNYTIQDKLDMTAVLLDGAKKDNAENYIDWYSDYLTKSGKRRDELERQLVDYTLKMARGN